MMTESTGNADLWLSQAVGDRARSKLPNLGLVSGLAKACAQPRNEPWGVAPLHASNNVSFVREKAGSDPDGSVATVILTGGIRT